VKTEVVTFDKGLRTRVIPWGRVARGGQFKESASGAKAKRGGGTLRETEAGNNGQGKLKKRE